MPREGETRPCVRDGCHGTQTFSDHSHPPGWAVGFAVGGGQVVYPVESQPGWACDQSLDHWQAPDWRTSAWPRGKPSS